MQALSFPPWTSLWAETSVGQVPRAFVFEEQNGRDGDLGPGFHRLETLEAVLREPQRGLQLFEEQLDLASDTR